MGTVQPPIRVDPRTPAHVVTISDISEIDIDALTALSERAWRHPYIGKIPTHARKYYCVKLPVLAT
jgi:hypothetical protein